MATPALFMSRCRQAIESDCNGLTI